MGNDPPKMYWRCSPCAPSTSLGAGDCSGGVLRELNALDVSVGIGD